MKSLTEFGIPIKLAWLIKMCSNETYSTVCRDFHLEYAISKGQENQEGLELSERVVYADVYSLGKNYTIK